MGDGAACHMRSLTEMRPVAEGLMRLPVPVDLKGLPVLITVFIAVGAGLNGHHRIALRNVTAADLGIFHHQA